MGISTGQFNELKTKYGDFSSFVYWNNWKNVDCISFFHNTGIVNKLNNEYIFVALNPSRAQQYIKFKNFHSDSKRQRDFKLCYAFAKIGNPFWGSYITDLFKHFVDVDSDRVRDYVKNNPVEVKRDISELEDEIQILSPKNEIVIIAIGGLVYRYLRRYLRNKNKIVKIPHYSDFHRINASKENYCKNVYKALRGAKLVP